MPHLTYPTSPDGLTLPLMIGLDGGVMAARLAAGQPFPALQLVQGLIDTASDITVLSPNLVSRLGLVPVGDRSTQTTIGSAIAKLYEASLSIVGPMGAGGPTLDRSPLLVMGSFSAFAGGIEAVMGLDVLFGCLLIFDGPGKQFTLAF